MLEKIQSQLEHLDKSERKIVEIILASPDSAIHSGIAAPALEASVNEPTTNRFYRDMDTRDFPDFKLHLVQSPASSTPYVNRNANEDDSVESYTGKILESAMAMLDRVRHSLNKSAIDHAVDLFTQAKKIAFFGLGSSVAAAHNAVNKFFRFNVPVVYPGGIVLQRMDYMNCGDGDVVILVPHAGRTENLVELVQLTCKNDAMVIALTSVSTPFTRGATLAIALDVPEDTDIYMPIVSRLAQLAIIDMLTTGFTLRRGVKFRDNLRRVKEVSKESCFDKQLPNLSDDR